jgi:5-bromo-4-chloroindolyl phosphate hydrolysis protein
LLETQALTQNLSHQDTKFLITDESRIFLHDLKRLGSDERNSLESGTDRAVQHPARRWENQFLIPPKD